jgi:putative transposase
MEPESTPISGHGLLTMPDAVWELARRRAEVIAPLAGLSIIGKQAVDEASRELGISRRHVYLLIKRYREGSGVVTDVAPGHSSGGQGKGRLPERVEAVIDELVRKHYLTRQKLSRAAFYREVVQACRTRELPVPALNTVTRRIARLHPVEVRRSREGRDAVRPLQSAGGNVPAIVAPLDQVQIDHTVIDLIVVDDRDRQPIGRPYLTVAIDVYSRCLLGMVVTLEAPSSVSVGLCIAHMACDKRPWLETLGVDAAWPMSGKPRALFLDNAAEFKSEALRRGCEQHGIRLNYRPPGRPHYGGIVERIIGTAMQRVHELPGTTFSNPGQRGGYDADKISALTLIELERWLTLAVAGYHGSIHGSLNQTPAGRWHEGVGEFGAQPAGHPAQNHPDRFCHRPCPLLRERAQAVDCAAGPGGKIHHPAGPARHQQGLGAGPGGNGLCGSAVPYGFPSGGDDVGTPAGADAAAPAGTRPGQRGSTVPHDRSDARDHRHGATGNPQITPGSAAAAPPPYLRDREDPGGAPG